jgi:four helix bundle protein
VGEDPNFLKGEKMKNFRTYQLSIEFHKDCQNLKLSAVAKDQFDRALLSIPLNLAEGAAKPTEKDRRRFYFTALGSMREVQTIIALFGTPALAQKGDVLAAHLYRLCHPHR